MRRRPFLIFVLGILLVALASLGAVQWRARADFLTRGWAVNFADPVADTPGAEGATLSRACVNASLDAYSGDDLAWALDTIRDGGFAWVRQRISWAETETQQGKRDWSRVDAIVSGTDSRALQLLVVLDDAPLWAGMPPDPESFAAWAGAVAERYGDSVTYYQIWHNPNLGDGWGGVANPFEYTALLSQAAQAIRGVDPEARIVLGSLAPTVEQGNRNYAEDLFLDMLYDAGAAPYFDVVAAQPYGFNTGPLDRRVSPEILNFSRVILVREALAMHGESGKAVWAADFGWNSKPPDWPGPASIWGSVDEDTQAAHTAAALDRVEREWPWMGLMCLNGLQPRQALDVGSVPDAQEHWGFALVGPGRAAGMSPLGPGEPRAVYEAVRSWTARPAAAHVGVYRADTDLASFSGAWTLGPQGADIGQTGDRVSLVFKGTDLALTVRRGPYRAFLFVTVDGEPAPALPRDREDRAYVVLYDPLSAVATVPLAEDLPAGYHTVEVVAERGWGQWALADWRILDVPGESEQVAWGYVCFAAMALAGLVVATLAAPRVEWGAIASVLRGTWQRVSDWLQVVTSFVATAVTLFAAWQTLSGNTLFRRLGDHGQLAALALSTGLFYFSPWFLVTLVSGLVMALLLLIRPSLGLALVMLAAPFYLHPLSLFGKSFSLAELALLPALAGWLLHLASRRVRAGRSEGATTGPHVRELVWPMLAFVILAVASSLGADHRREALRELRLVVLEPVLLLLACISLPMEKRDRWRVVDAWVLSGLVVAVVGLVQYFLLGDVITAEGGVRRLRSIYGSPNNVGLYLGRLLPVLLAVVAWSRTPRNGEKGKRHGSIGRVTAASHWVGDLFHDVRRTVYLVVLLPIGMALLLSLSRGAIVLGIPAAMVALGWLAGGRWRIVTVVCLIAGVLSLVPLLQTPRFATMFDPNQGTTGFRISLWYSTLGLIEDHPVLGVGLDNFLYAYRTRYVLPTAWEEFNLSHPHNVLLDFAARLGLPGLAVFLWTQVIFWRRGLPVRRAQAPAARALGIGVMASMVDFLAHGLVDASYFAIDLAFVYMLSQAIVVWLAEGEFVSIGRNV